MTLANDKSHLTLSALSSCGPKNVWSTPPEGWLCRALCEPLWHLKKHGKAWPGSLKQTAIYGHWVISYLAGHSLLNPFPNCSASPATSHASHDLHHLIFSELNLPLQYTHRSLRNKLRASPSGLQSGEGKEKWHWYDPSLSEWHNKL